MKSKSNLLLILILTLGAVLRIIYALSLKSLWLDEIAWINIAKLPTVEIIYGNYSIFAHHFFLSYLILKVFSYFSLAEFWLRIPYLFASIVTILGVYFLVLELFNSKKTAVLAIFLLSLSTYQIRFSPEIKVYSLLLAFEVFSLLFFIKIIKELKINKFSRINVSLFFVLSVLSLFLDYSFALLFIVYLIIFFREFILNRNKARHKIFQYIFGSLILISLTIIPWLPKLIKSFINERAQMHFIQKPQQYDLIETTMAYSTYFDHKYATAIPKQELWWEFITILTKNVFIAQSIYYFLNFLLFTFLIFIVFKNLPDKFKEELLYLKLLFIVPITIPFIASIFIIPVFIHYRLMIAHIGLIILMAYNLLKYKKANIFFLTIYIFLNISSYFVLLKYGTFQDYKKIYEFVTSKNLNDRSAVLVLPDYHVNAFNFYSESNKKNFPYEYKALSYEETLNNEYFSQVSTYIREKEKICYVYDPGFMENKMNKYVLNILDMNFILFDELHYVSGFEVNCYRNLEKISKDGNIPYFENNPLK